MLEGSMVPQIAFQSRVHMAEPAAFPSPHPTLTVMSGAAPGPQGKSSTSFLTHSK